MLPQSLLPDSQAFVLDSFDVQTDAISLQLRLAQAAIACPDCEQPAARVHSHYTRTLADLPWANHAVRWRLGVRRFFCDNPKCPRRTFTEQAPPTVTPYARRTPRLKEAQTNVGFATCGEPGATLTDKLHMKTSPDTLLRAVRRKVEPIPPMPRAVGIDDWAMRKGQRYGTILIDLERRQPIDLLPDRESATVATWLRAHPGIEIVTRDRASAYANAISQGAPQATQVADRWHLLCNPQGAGTFRCREAIERMLERHQSVLRKIKLVSAPIPATLSKEREPGARTPARKTVSALRRARRLQRYQEIKDLQASGLSQHAIARKLHLHRQTVRHYVLADEFPERASRAMEPNELTPFLGYLLSRWQDGHHNARQLWREIRQQGYRGSKNRVYYWTVKQRAPSLDGVTGQPAATATGKALSARKASWLLVRAPADLKVEEQELLQQLLAHGAELKGAYELAQRFGTMVRERRADELTDWLQGAKTSGLNELKNFAMGLERDLNAVRAGLSMSWSNGPTEGHINRLKLIKRQMYGRANFDLLRRRVLEGY